MNILLVMGFLATPASPSTSYEGVLIAKQNFSGYVPPEWVRNEKCEIYYDKVVITRSFGLNNTITEIRPLVVSPGISELIEDSSQEEIESSDNFLCDAPSTAIVAYNPQPDGNAEVVELFSAGGCGSPRRFRKGYSADNLRDMIGTYCPKTHDFSHD